MDWPRAVAALARTPRPSLTVWRLLIGIAELSTTRAPCADFGRVASGSPQGLERRLQRSGTTNVTEESS